MKTLSRKEVTKDLRESVAFVASDAFVSWLDTKNLYARGLKDDRYAFRAYGKVDGHDLHVIRPNTMLPGSWVVGRVIFRHVPWRGRNKTYTRMVFVPRLGGHRLEDDPAEERESGALRKVFTAGAGSALAVKWIDEIRNIETAPKAGGA